jgi:hypothetical protein
MGTVGKVLIFVYSTAVCFLCPWPLNIAFLLLLLCGTRPSLGGEDGQLDTEWIKAAGELSIGYNSGIWWHRV